MRSLGESENSYGVSGEQEVGGKERMLRPEVKTARVAVRER